MRTASAIDAGREALGMAKRLLATKQSFTYLVVLIYIGTADVATNIERIRSRVAKGGHDVPEEDQRRRFPRSLAHASVALAIADEAVILDNSSSDGYRKVAVKKSGEMKLFGTLPRWASFVLAK